MSAGIEMEFTLASIEQRRLSGFLCLFKFLLKYMHSIRKLRIFTIINISMKHTNPSRPNIP